ncbi:MAG: N-6 DNA methylase [Promethearchaeota archaeon]
MVEYKKVGKKDISITFGLSSEIYKNSMDFFTKSAQSSRKKEYEITFTKWKKLYKEIYGGVLDSELFLKHTYFSLVLKSLLITRLSLIQNIDFAEAYRDFRSNNLEAFYIFEFDTFYWIDFSKKLFSMIYDEIENKSFMQEDLFINFYQELFFADIRHKIGEFYTPSNLVEKMVNDFYEFGKKILDPSCGSGNFLINIIISILNNKEKSNEEKLDAINNVYGFDVNPLATYTAKINIFLVFLEHFDFSEDQIPNVNIYIIDSLFPERYESQMRYNLTNLYDYFDLIIGNPPWITYKDLNSKKYQEDIRNLAERFKIKPMSHYITHIELAAVFFYAVTKFLKFGGKIFLIITKSVLNGDHCYKFRAFSIFDNLEIWDFPSTNIFNIPNICLKAEYIGIEDHKTPNEKYPIKTKIFNENLSVIEETHYSSLKIEKEGAKLIIPVHQLELLHKISYSSYKSKFYQGATLVPRTLIFFKMDKNDDSSYLLSSDPDILSRAKNKWKFEFQNREIEREFKFKSFLNKDLVPFCLKKYKRVFLPINEAFLFDTDYLNQYPKAMKFYSELDEIYQKNKKQTSSINTLFSNMNYWNKLTKQNKNNNFIVIYNASGSSLKSAVIKNFKKTIIIPSENYYYSTDSKDEAFYLSAILNAPILSNSIKLIKSSRHIHKRPFSFPIPQFNESNESHLMLSKLGKKYRDAVRDIVNNNPQINADKVRMLINKKLVEINLLVEQVVFK